MLVGEVLGTPVAAGSSAVVPIGGPRFIYNYVLLELAHRRRDELLLWDG